MSLNECRKLRHLIIIKDREGRRAIPLEMASYSIGRSDSNSIVLYGPCISRQHATILRIPNPDNELTRFRIIDGSLNGTKSTNGLYINDNKSFSHDLQHRDVIEFGDEVTIQYYVLSNLSDADFQKFCQVDDLAGILNNPAHKDDTLKIARHHDLDSNEIAIARLASFPELNPNPIIEIDLAGNITYTNPTAILEFPQLQNLGIQHPIIAQLPSLVKLHNAKYFVREIEFDNRILEEGIHYIAESELLRVFITDITERKQVETEKIQQDNLLQNLLKVSHLSFDEQLRNLLKMGCDYFQLNAGVLCQVEGNILTILQVYAQPNHTFIFKPREVFDLSEPLKLPHLICFHKTLNSIEPFSDYHQNNRELEYFSRLGYLGIRIVFEEKVLGILSFVGSNDLEKKFTAAELDYLKLMSQWLGKEIANHQTQNVLRKQAQQATLLKGITQAINQGLNTPEILYNIVRQIGQTLEVNRCSIHYYKEKPDISIPCVAEYLQGERESMLNVDIALVNSPYIQKVLSQDGSVISDLSCDIASDDVSTNFRQQLAIESMLTVRTSHRGKVNGLLAIYRDYNSFNNTNTNNHDWTATEIELIEIVAQQVGILIAQSQLLEKETLQKILLNKREQELKATKEILSKTVTEKNHFLVNAVKHIQILNNKITNDLEFLKNKDLSSEQECQLQSIQQNCDDILTLTNDLINLSHLESGKNTLDKQPFKLEPCFKEVIKQTLSQATNQNLKLSYHLESQVPPAIIQDLPRFQQILTDFMVQGMHWAEVTAIEIFVTAFLVDSEQNNYEILFTIYNQGIVLSLEQLISLLTPFSKDNNFSQKVYDSLGLRLAICKQLVTMMGGNLWIASQGQVTGNYPAYWQLDRNMEPKENSGLTFYFTILAQSVGMI